MRLQEIDLPKNCPIELCSFSSEKFRVMLTQLYTLPDAAREEVHRRLAALPYRDFLRSWYWDACRSEELSRAGYRCRRCRAEKVRLQVHHIDYDHRGREHEHIEDLRAVCDNCHVKAHQLGGSRSIAEKLGIVSDFVQPPPKRKREL